MRSSHAPRRHVATLIRLGVVALLAGLVQVVASAPAQAQPPNGALDVLTSPSAGAIHVEGWAYDADSASTTVRVDIVVDGVVAWGVDASEYRADVGPHGYRLSLQGNTPGTRSVQVVAVDVQDGSRHVIGSGSVNVSDGSPTGAVDSATSPTHRTLDLKGWASDPSSTGSPVAIEVYVGGDFTTAGVEYHGVSANLARSDGAKGFSTQFTTNKTGSQPIYVYAKNVAGTPGGDRLIAQLQVTIYADTTPPDTKITSAPPTVTADQVVQVTFSADEPNATFQCRWDQEAWFACQTSTQIKLAPGKHQIAVRASDAYGNQDKTPAVYLVTVTAAATTQPPPPPGGQSGRSVVGTAVKKKSRLRIDVGPDSASSNYRVVIQRKAGKRWHKVERVRTRGPKDTVVVNLRRGRYRVVLPKSAAGPALTSNTVRLKR